MTTRRPRRTPKATASAAPTTRDFSQKETAELYMDLLGLDDDGRRRLKEQIADCYRQLDLKRT